jgi:hypothetical protein
MNRPDEPDVETLRAAREEARRTLDAQLSTLDDIDSKSVAVFRLNVALAGLLVSALSFAARGGPVAPTALLNPVTGVGALLFVLSAALAALAYTVTGQQVGAGPNGLGDATGLSERAFLERLVGSYAAWIRYNERTNVQKALLVTLSVLGTVAGTLALAAGALVAFIDAVTLPVAGVAIGLLLVAGLALVADHLRRLFGSADGPPDGVAAPQSLDADERIAGQRTFKGRDRGE